MFSKFGFHVVQPEFKKFISLSSFFVIIIPITNHQSSSLAECRQFVELDPAMTTSVKTVLQPQH